jgi:hypothetical protein
MKSADVDSVHIFYLYRAWGFSTQMCVLRARSGNGIGDQPAARMRQSRSHEKAKPKTIPTSDAGIIVYVSEQIAGDQNNLTSEFDVTYRLTRDRNLRLSAGAFLS